MHAPVAGAATQKKVFISDEKASEQQAPKAPSAGRAIDLWRLRIAGRTRSRRLLTGTAVT